jgi:hypothetical protein
MHQETLQSSFFKYFLEATSLEKVSADKRMVRAKGPVWHARQKQLGIVPKGLRGLDKAATWAKSKAKGWIYGHGTFMLTPLTVPIVGIFQWMQNSANEAKRMQEEVKKYAGAVKKVFMDSKADDQSIYYDLKHNHRMQLVTVPRRGMAKSRSRQRMIKEMLTKRNRKDYKERSTTVEPMQGLVADIFELNRCWMRGDVNNRWCFAAMGIAVQIAQWNAWKAGRSTWDIKSEVLGV